LDSAGVSVIFEFEQFVLLDFEGFVEFEVVCAEVLVLLVEDLVFLGELGNLAVVIRNV
jgi:hypothetical protein